MRRKGCKVCRHPRREWIEQSMKDNVPYRAICEEVNRDEHSEKIEPYTLSRHLPHMGGKSALIADERIVVRALPQADLLRLALPPESQRVAVSEALELIIYLGVQSLLYNPETITPAHLLTAIDLARRLNVGGEKNGVLQDAWKEVEEAIKQQRKKKKQDEIIIEG